MEASREFRIVDKWKAGFWEGGMGSMDILYLLDRLENLISSSRRVPLVNRVLIKEADILHIIDQMRTAIPDEVKRARRIIQDKESILAQAQADAKNIQGRAYEEAEKALQRESLLKAAHDRSQEIMRLATEQAQMIMRRTEEQSEQLKVDSDNYATETLRSLLEHLMSIETEIERTVLSIEKGLETLDNRPRVPDSAMGEESSIADQEVMDTPPPLPLSPRPRRASLAADTMGTGPEYR
jgi:hypothetical protein